MWKLFAILVFGVLSAAGASAHHGWGSYDAANPVTVKGTISSSRFENPHASIVVSEAGRQWTITLAPTSRMTARGATAEVVAVGTAITAFGYPSTVEKDEMRAERITVAGKTYELR
jgi:hypothetical protein